MNEATKQRYFGELAPNYSKLTGNTTQDIFAKFLDTHDLGITSASIVHDNAAGPGTATQILISRGLAPTITATDYAPAMIEALNTIKAANIHNTPAWANVTARVADSSDLSLFGDEHFTHSINNFSLFTISDAVQSLRETYRTLRRDGVAAVLLWKRYPVQHLLAAAQDHVKGEGYAAQHAVPVNGPRYFEEGVVAGQMREAGFEDAKIETKVVEYILTEDESVKWDGLREFMTSSSAAMGSVRGWSEDETKRWPEAVRWAMDREKERYGGIYCEAWVTVARK